ncbi:MAG: SDR family NAD(P)-dependent oxidoreductase [Chloroflexota bacterium]|nr:SDR family NAD(P)-dependent oxidoreductase [Chloroflexota bacterium]MDE2854756.1 SDR family NAD(P)-dependent oxidoreductase [Chloroflexota bacterium]MDE2945581.1 SDR family NAD(P)-dependent oxidoreductase [Chloroflexota bacterium]
MRTKTAVITGAGQGTGRAIALRFAKAGIGTLLLGRTERKLRRVAEEVSALGGEASVHPLDLTDDAAVAAFGGALDGETVDILVNCAGDWLISLMDDTSNEQLDHILRLNLRAPYILSRLLLPNLRRSENASIINIGSMVTTISVPTVSAYTAAKVGLKGLTGSLAAELKPERIRVVMISPGPADTPMRAAASPDIDKTRLLPPETIADMVYAVATLPRGISTSDFLLYSMAWE